MTTIQDVAKYANVGAATVSRVLSGKGYVKNETRQKVEAAIADLNYTPNEIARNLYFHKTGIVVVIVPEVAHPFFAEFVNAVEACLCEKGYQMMICNTYYQNDFELRYLDMLKQQRVDGIIFGGHRLDLEPFQKIDRPIVALDRDLGERIPCVSADHRTGGRLAALELIQAGCKNVVQFGTKKTENDQNASSPSGERHAVFEETMEEQGINCYSLPMAWNRLDNDYFVSIAQKVLDEHPDIDGVFATDRIALATVQAAWKKGKRVPDDLKVVAYDGTSDIRLAAPSITFIAQPIEKLAEECVRLIVDMIEGKCTRKVNIELPVELVRGESTKGNGYGKRCTGKSQKI